jgi:hypothetical protein
MSSGTSTLQLMGIGRKKLHAHRAHAKSAGVTPETYARQLLEESISLEQKARSANV